MKIGLWPRAIGQGKGSSRARIPPCVAYSGRSRQPILARAKVHYKTAHVTTQSLSNLLKELTPLGTGKYDNYG